MAKIGRDAVRNVALRSGAWLALLAMGAMNLAAAQPSALPACAVCALYERAPAEAQFAAQVPQASAAFPDWAVARHRAVVRESRAAVGSVNPW